jgi:hypothetical protein
MPGVFATQGASIGNTTTPLGCGVVVLPREHALDVGRRTPAVVLGSHIVATHALAPWALAVLHLSPPGGEAPDLEYAPLAIDALGELVEGRGPRLGRHEEPLREALSELRLAFVEMSRRAEGGAGDRSG